MLLQLISLGSLFPGCSAGLWVTPVCSSFWSPHLGQLSLRPLVAAFPEKGVAQDCGWGWAGTSQAHLLDHKSELIAELPSTEAQCLPGRTSPGKRKLPEGHNCSLPCRDPVCAADRRGLTYSPRPHGLSRAAPGPNLRSSDP